MVIQISLKNYPQELIKGRESAEATFVFCLWKQPDLFDDFQRINVNDDRTLKTEDGTFYFSLGRQMYNQGFRSFDNVTIYTFLENKPTVKKHFDELGGYATVSELCSLVNPENVGAPWMFKSLKTRRPRLVTGQGAQASSGYPAPHTALPTPGAESQGFPAA